MLDKIFIGTPCYGGMITADYFKSCLQLTALAATKKIELQFGTIGNESLITRARNTLVQLFMDEEQYTHLLFIDADIAFNPESVFRMLDLDEDVVTGGYPRKTIDWRKVKRRAQENPDISEDELHAASLEYNLNVKDPNKVLSKKGFIEVYDFNTWRPYCHVKDFARLINKVISSKNILTSYQVFNAGGNKNNFKKKKIAKIIKNKIGGKVVLLKKSQDKRNYVVDFSKVKKILNFIPKYSVSYGVKEILKNLKLEKYKKINFSRNNLSIA